MFEMDGDESKTLQLSHKFLNYESFWRGGAARNCLCSEEPLAMLPIVRVHGQWKILSSLSPSLAQQYFPSIFPAICRRKIGRRISIFMVRLARLSGDFACISSFCSLCTSVFYINNISLAHRAPIFRSLAKWILRGARLLLKGTRAA